MREVQELIDRRRISPDRPGLRGYRAFALTAAILVIYGGFMLRYLTVEIGQVSTWMEYAIQFDPQLLQRLTE